VNSRAKSIKLVISISLIKRTIRNNIDCKNTIRNIVAENHRNFQSINSYLFIGLDKIKNIVFQSISLKSS